MFKWLIPCLAPAIALFPSLVAGHFQTLIPSHDLIHESTPRGIQLDMRFTHPMSRGPVMAMGEPVQFGVLGPDGHQDLRDTLTPYKVAGATAYRADFRFNRPGDYLFYLQPAPYWEPAEGVMIEHYTKVVVDAFAAESGWHRSVGFPVEIEPLTRPFGLWTGNQFQGVVKRNGQPVPFAEVEVEWLNDGSVTPPTDAYITQVVRADANGTFSYVMPRAGWWGFAALLEGPEKMPNPAGQLVPVEQGALIWVFTRDMP